MEWYGQRTVCIYGWHDEPFCDIWWENVDLALSSVGKKNEVVMCSWLRQDQLIKRAALAQESS